MPHLLIKACLDMTMETKVMAKITIKPGMYLFKSYFMKMPPINVRIPIVMQRTIDVPKVDHPFGKAAARLVHLAILGVLGSTPQTASSRINHPMKHAHQSSFCSTGVLLLPLLILSISFFLDELN
jgi:hypothetical protein